MLEIVEQGAAKTEATGLRLKRISKTIKSESFSRFYAVKGVMVAEKLYCLHRNSCRRPIFHR